MNQNKILGVILVTLVSLVLTVFGVQQGCTKVAPLSEIVIPGTLNLEQATAPASTLSTTPSSRRVEIYLDVSEPMAGYLASRDGEQIGFRHVGQAVPVQMLRTYGTVETVQWYRVAERVRPLADEPSWQRDEYDGAETFLDLPARQAIANLESGEIEVAAILTDLVATREVAGGIGLSNVLLDWLDSTEVRSGDFDLGLLGLKVPYRGVSSSRCLGNRADLGCWFSEGAQLWKPMTESVNRPLYVLVFGRTKSAVGADRVDTFGRYLRDAMRNLGLEVQWELLTRAQRDRAAQVSCRVRGEGPKNQQFVLRLKENRGYKCLQDGVVDFDCQVDYAPNAAFEDEILPNLRVENFDLSWPEKWVRSELDQAGRITMILNCEHLRDEPRNDDLEIARLDVALDTESAWDSWSTESDELEGNLSQTLQLAYFVEQVQPQRLLFKAEASVLSKGGDP